MSCWVVEIFKPILFIFSFLARESLFSSFWFGNLNFVLRIEGFWVCSGLGIWDEYELGLSWVVLISGMWMENLGIDVVRWIGKLGFSDFVDEATMWCVEKKWRLDLKLYMWGAISFQLRWFPGRVYRSGSFAYAPAFCSGRVWFSLLPSVNYGIHICFPI